MELTTKCPHCGSVFQASLEQLQLRKGYIRCIQCANIFDGFESVVPTAPSARPDPSIILPTHHGASNTAGETSFTVSNPQPADVSGVPGERSGARAEEHTRSFAPTFTIPDVVDSGEPSLIVGRDHTLGSDAPVRPLNTGRAEPLLGAGHVRHAARATPEPAVIRQPRIQADPRAAAVDDSEPLPDFLDDHLQRRQGIIRVFWSVLIVVGILAILAQLIYVYRVPIASNMPGLRPILTQACEAVGCTVPYPRRIELISIMDSSLQAVSPPPEDARKDESHLRLLVTLRNNFEKAQEWPTLSLDMVEFSGAVVVKKLLAPKDYLSADMLKGPFAAKTEVRVSVPVTVTGFKINGYQLGKFFP